MGGVNIADYNIPIYNTIIRYSWSGTVPFHMPGHKLGKGFPPELLDNLALLDVTEIPGTDNLHYPTGAIKEAQELAARAFCADRTFFLVNGSTCGIHTMIMSICKPGDKLIVSRDCHKSVLGGMMLAGVRPVYIKPAFNRHFGISTTVTPSDVEAALRENPDAVGVFITRPTYYGICSDIREIARIVHSHGKVLAVDEAHGAHLAFHESLPECAMQGGADICVQSAHKTIPAFTQGAYLHVKSNSIDIDRLIFNLRLLQTSSPSYIIMAFLDIARAVMEKDGRGLLGRLLTALGGLRQSVSGSGGGLSLLSEEDAPGSRQDPTRLVANVRGLGIMGFEAETLFRSEWGIQPEMSDLANVVFITCASDTPDDIDRLCSALTGLSNRFGSSGQLSDIFIGDLAIPPQVVDLKDVMTCSCTRVKLREASGKVCRAIVTPYPPGIPVLCPGEIIMDDAVEFIYNIIRAGGNVTGLDEDCTVEVALI